MTATGVRRSLALAAGLVLTPILWLHYLVLLARPHRARATAALGALARPSSPLTVFEALDWYRGWPSGDGDALASVAVVVAVVFVVSSRPSEPEIGRERRLAAWL